MSKRNPKENRVRVSTLSPSPTDHFDAGVLKDYDAECEWHLPIRAEARGADLPYDVDMLIALDERRDRAQLVVVELTLRRRPGDEPITSSAFRVPLRVQRLLREAVVAATISWGDQDAIDDAKVQREASRVVHVPGPSGTPGRKFEIPDEDLGRVLRTYEAAGGKGRGGTDAVAQMWNVHRTTAWKAVQRAQARKGATR